MYGVQEVMQHALENFFIFYGCESKEGIKLSSLTLYIL